MAEIDFNLLQEMINCAKREVAFRYKCYPRWVANGKMTQQQADKEKALMYAIQKALQKIYDGTAPIPVQTSFLNAQDYIKPKQWHG
jgi:hypothetical protein